MPQGYRDGLHSAVKQDIAIERLLVNAEHHTGVASSEEGKLTTAQHGDAATRLNALTLMLGEALLCTSGEEDHRKDQTQVRRCSKHEIGRAHV